MKALQTNEAARLTDLEAVIEKGKRTFVEVGEALAEIRDNRLYRAEFKTFEEYCLKRWDFTRMQASRLINASVVAASLPENVTHGLQSERQSRELGKVEPAKRIEVLNMATAAAKAEDRPALGDFVCDL